MRTIFISYRRDDTAPYAGRLFDKLTVLYGEDRVFMDIDSIRPGADFVEILEAKLAASDTMLIVIGKNWLSAKDDDGLQRLQNPKDFVRLEVAEAITRDILIIPLLVGGAIMPREEQLPRDIALLARRQAIDISDLRFHSDVGKLIKIVEDWPKEAKQTNTPKKANVDESSEIGTKAIDSEVEESEEKGIDEQASIFNRRITYELERTSGIIKKELPFVIGVLADLSGHRAEPLPRLKEPSRRFIHIERSSFTNIMKNAQPRLVLKLRDPSAGHNPDIALELEFTSVEDFSPSRIVERVPVLRDWLDLAIRLDSLPNVLDKKMENLLELVLQSSDDLAAVRKESQNPEIEPSGELYRLTEAGFPQIDENERTQVAPLIRDFFFALVDDDLKGSTEVRSVIARVVMRIKSKFSVCLNAILHHQEYQRLEATWRGLQYLVTKIDDASQVKVKVLNISKPELRKDLERAVEFDQSGLFYKVYDEELGTFGGEPYGVLIGDYYYGRHPSDVVLLKDLSYVAASAHAPFVAGVDPSMFGWESLAEMKHHTGKLARIFEGHFYSKWKGFRESIDSRYVYLTLPRLLLRTIYTGVAEATKSFEFEELIDSPEQYSWANSAFVLAASLAEAFQSRRTGVQTDGLEAATPFLSWGRDSSEISLFHYGPSEVDIKGPYLSELKNLGFIPLRYEAAAGKFVFESMRSCASPKLGTIDQDGPTDVGELDLRALLTRCRLNHYLRVLDREKSGLLISRKDAEQFLNSWLWQYVKEEEGAVEFVEVPYQPGSYRLRLMLVPNVQLRWKKGLTENGKKTGMKS